MTLPGKWQQEPPPGNPDRLGMLIAKATADGETVVTKCHDVDCIQCMKVNQTSTVCPVCDSPLDDMYVQKCSCGSAIVRCPKNVIKVVSSLLGVSAYDQI